MSAWWRSSNSAASASAPVACERGRYSRDGSVRKAQLFGAAGERVREQRHRLGACRHQQRALLGQLAIPGGQRVRACRARADPGEQRVALRQRARVGGPSLGSCGPDGGDEVVEVRSAGGRRALHQLQALRQEHRQQRPRGRRRQAVHRRAVDAQRLLHPRLHADLDQVRAVVALRRDGDARHLLLAPDQLAVVGGARRSTGAAEVQRLEEVGLAGAVRPGDHGQPRPERDLGRRVVAEVPEGRGGDPHGGGYTFSRIGMTR